MNTFVDIRKTLVDQVVFWIEEHIPKSEQEIAKKFAELYYKQAPVGSYSFDSGESQGSFLCLWSLIQKLQSNQTLIRVYNPSIEEKSWHSTHTVIDILTSDVPFLLSSLTMELKRQEIQIYNIAHPVINIARDESGQLLSVHAYDETYNDNDYSMHTEVIIRIEVERFSSQKELDPLEESLKKVILNVGLVVSDWPHMQEKLNEAIEHCEQTTLPLSAEVVKESLDFLRWLQADNFLFLGYQYYKLDHDKNGAQIVHHPETALGSLRCKSNDATIVPISSYVVSKLQTPELLIITKSTERSNIQRPVYFDHIGIKHFDDEKNVIGEWRFLGLFTSNAYIEPLANIPLLNTKSQRLLTCSGVPRNSHSGRALMNIINHYPRDELLQTDFQQLSNIIYGVIECQERLQLKVFLRPDTYDLYMTAIIYIPRERFNTSLRKKVQTILLEELEGDSIDFSVHLSENPLAQVHFIVHCKNSNEKGLRADKIEQRINDAMLLWRDRLQQVLVENMGEAEGNSCFRKYADTFPAAYKEEVSARQAIIDIENIEVLSDDSPIKATLYHSVHDVDKLHFRVLGRGEMLALSSVIPILDKMGVSVFSVCPYIIWSGGMPFAWILDFKIGTSGEIHFEDLQLREQFQQTFIRIWLGEIENDGFNGLILSADVSWETVILLRAIARYMKQLAVPFSQTYMHQTLAANSKVTHKLTELFHVFFNPEFTGNRETTSAAIVTTIHQELEQVSNLDEDRILRNYLTILQAMQRTNFYQLTEEGQRKPYLSFKVRTSQIQFAPLPHPAYEIFVYSTRLEGVHMRGGKVARGGLRWSDRQEDFRTEILGLIKAQLIKNAVIVPVGAKGGFVPKKLPTEGNREEYLAEGIASYRMFIQGLLDITDNLNKGEIVPPEKVIRRDDDDPYLVVAADKGTATFSDIANQVSADYDFWLGDAFASGGSQGYDHKKMGITARGAWESVKCLFQELGTNTQTEDFTVVGVGDMSGDVFGNGMLLSEHIRLVAAFNHLHIFIDPIPDAATSFQERKRLFELPRSSWTDYNASLISKGGGIYSRQSKLISLNPEVKKALGIQNEDSLTPTDLIKEILKAPVDLLWNGGIGTYVKATTETHEQVGDRSNNGLRIDATEIAAKVVGEGGNLGLTQAARIEFSRKGGLINTDAVDNSAGVDTSDHEVNIKILLNHLVSIGDLTTKQRNQMLEEMTEEVSQLVLRHNMMQSRRLSLSNYQARRLFGDHRLLITQYEKEGRLNRSLERLPSKSELQERAKVGETLTRPEISVLLSFTKLKIFDELVQSDIDKDAYLSGLLIKYFPSLLRNKYVVQINTHQLKKEILATCLANEVGNLMGAPFMEYVRGETHRQAIDIVKAFLAAWEIFELAPIWNAFNQMGVTVNNDSQLEEMTRFQKYIEKATIWLLRKYRQDLDVKMLIRQYQPGMREVSDCLTEMLGESDRTILKSREEKLIKAGLSGDKALSCINLRYRYYMLDIIGIAERGGQPVTETASVYFALEEQLKLPWLRAQLRNLPENDLWQRKACALLRDQLDNSLSANTTRVMTIQSDDTTSRLTSWSEDNQYGIERWQHTVEEIQSTDTMDLAMLSVAVQELSRLAAMDT